MQMAGSIIDTCDDEVREDCFHCFETFVLRYPKEISPHVDAITSVALRYIGYDPNYNYESAFDDEMEGNDDDYQ